MVCLRKSLELKISGHLHHVTASSFRDWDDLLRDEVLVNHEDYART